MALPVIYNGYYYQVSEAGMISTTGPGVAPTGLNLAFTDTFNSTTMQAAVDAAPITASARAALSASSIQADTILREVVGTLQVPAQSVPVLTDTTPSGYEIKLTPAEIQLRTDVADYLTPSPSIYTPASIPEIQSFTNKSAEYLSPTPQQTVNIPNPVTDIVNNFIAGSKGLTLLKNIALSSVTTNTATLPDWRAKLSLAPSADYLYNAPNPGIMGPLRETKGVIFPYTPSIQVSYSANYDATTLTHSNYKIFQYGSSSVDSINITCDFTAQDANEAAYLLAVIHFFKTVTKMFYGKDSMPKNGTPPPLCYLTGFGQFQFDKHPMAVNSFNYSLPTDVDYIPAAEWRPGSSAAATMKSPTTGDFARADRLLSSGLVAGAATPAPQWSTFAKSSTPTYVPTKMQIQVTAVPIVSRYDISNEFSLAKYATGALNQGSTRVGGGMW